MSLSVRRRAFFLLSFLVFFGAAQASASVNRKDTARGIYGETSSDHFPAPTAVTISDSVGPLLEITSFGKCVTSESNSCAFEDVSNSTPNFVYFYVVRFLRTPTGQTKLTIPGQFEDPIFLATLEANTPPINMDVFAGVITDDQTNIAACMTPQSTSTSLITCDGAFFDATDSTVDKTGAVLIINPGLQANDVIELHVDSYVPPACFSEPNAGSPSPFDCPANSFLTVSQNGTTLNATTPLQVIGPVQSLSADQSGNSISPFGTIVAQLNVTPASVTLPQSAPLPISITASTTANPPFIIGSNSEILWNGQPLSTTFTSPSGVPTVSATVATSLLASGGTATVTVTNGGATSDPSAFPLLAPDPQNISVPAAQQSLVQGSGPITFTVSGSGFLPSSIVQWNSSGPSDPNCFTGNNRPTTFVSSTELTATIFADDLRTDTATTPVIFVFAQPGTDSCGQVANVGFAADANSLTITAASSPLPTLSQTNVAFGSETVGVASAAQTVTLANNGNGTVSLTISSLTITGADAADFAMTSATTPCTANETLAPGHSCNLGVTFTPIHAGVRTASVQISNTNFGTISIPLTGTGVSPVPTLASIIPTTATAGTATFNLTLNGTNFTADSTVAFGANPPLTPSSTPTGSQIVVSVPAADIAAGGVMGVTVNNPAPGGGTSSPVINFTVNNPIPALTGFTPPSATVGGQAFTLTLNGMNFVSTTQVTFNGNAKIPTILSSTQLTINITAADLMTAVDAPVTVNNPMPGGGISPPQLFAINNPTPTITSFSPPSATAGGAAFTLTVNGTGFVSTSQVNLNGSVKSPTVLSSTQLTIPITAADIATAATVTVTVSDLGPGGGTSAPQQYAINNPNPAITSFMPASVIVGGTAFTLTVNGSGFVAASQVTFNGNAKTPTIVTGRQLTIPITATDIATAGTFPVKVMNGVPGGGSSLANFAVNNPVPVISSISPNSEPAGGPAFTLTVNGSNFVSASTVNFNGNARQTTFSSSTKLTAAITAADIATQGMPQITVTNLGPGGGNSNMVTLTVTPPPSFAIAASPTTVMTVASASGTMASQTSTITVTPSNGFSGPIAVTCATSIPGVTCGPLTIPAGSVSGNLTVNVLDPSTQMTAMLQPVPENQWAQGSLPDKRDRGARLTLSAGAFLAAFFVFFLPGRTRYRLAPALGAICAASLAMGCGGGYSGGGGTGTSPTVTQLTVSATKVALNGGITVSATVTGGTPDGNVQFFVDGNALGGTVPVMNGSTGNISLTAAQAPMFLKLVGTHMVSAHYLGGTYTAASASGTLNITVTGQTNLLITGTSGNLTPGAMVSLTIN